MTDKTAEQPVYKAGDRVEIKFPEMIIVRETATSWTFLMKTADTDTKLTRDYFIPEEWIVRKIPEPIKVGDSVCRSVKIISGSKITLADILTVVYISDNTQFCASGTQGFLCTRYLKDYVKVP